MLEIFKYLVGLVVIIDIFNDFVRFNENIFGGIGMQKVL